MNPAASVISEIKTMSGTVLRGVSWIGRSKVRFGLVYDNFVPHFVTCLPPQTAKSDWLGGVSRREEPHQLPRHAGCSNPRRNNCPRRKNGKIFKLEKLCVGRL